MTRLYSLALITWMLLACRPQPDTHVELAEDSTDRPRPAAGRIAVVEQVNRKGRDATMNYTLHIDEHSGLPCRG